jgi:endonuclease-3
VPPQYMRHAHHWLILLGRYTCKARTPECWRCIVSSECGYRPKAKAPLSGKGRASRA